MSTVRWWQVQGWSEVARGAALFDSILVFENYPVDALLQKQLSEQSGTLKMIGVQSKEQTNYPAHLQSQARQ